MPPCDRVYDSSKYGRLKVEKQDKVMTITLNAPESKPTICGREGSPSRTPRITAVSWPLVYQTAMLET